MTSARNSLGGAGYTPPRVQSALMIAIVLCSGACATSVVQHQQPLSAEQALAEAVRLRQHGRAFYSDSSVAQGLVVSLGQDRYKVGNGILAAPQLDSLYIRTSDDHLTAAVVLGAGVGALAGLFSGALLGLRTDSEANGKWAAVGAAIGAGLAAATRAAVADDKWVHRWPQRRQ